MTGKDYAQQIFVHLLDECDIVNAELVLRRVPDPIRKRNELLGHANQVLQALNEQNYQLAIQLLNQADPVQATLKRFLTEAYVPNFVVRIYTKIDRRVLIDMLNLKTDAELNALLSPHYTLEGTQFVSLKPIHRNTEVFGLTAEKVNRLTYVVQFLERQNLKF